MKQMKNLFRAVLALTVLFAAVSCEENNVTPNRNDSGILPDNFKVDIPSSISNSKYKSSFKSTETDTLNGNEIYENLALFIAVGEESANIVQDIIWGLHRYNIDKIIELTYTSDEDNRVKHLSVVEGGEYEGQNYKYTLTITDVDSEGNDDGGIALRLFWNSTPVEGVALLKPYNINREDDSELKDAIFSIEYSERGDNGYDAHMIIEIADIPLNDYDVYAIDNLKMFVGKKGEIVDVFGNSNHPNAHFFTDDKGFSWSFVASGNQESNISVAEVSLPPCTLNTDARETILKDYSIKNVLTDQINEWFLERFGFRPHEEDLANYLRNADAPGFFDEAGFIQGGSAPSEDYNNLIERMNSLTPYNPSEINELSISLE